MTIREIQPLQGFGPFKRGNRVIRELEFGDRVPLGLRHDPILGRREIIVAQYLGLDAIELIRIDGKGKQIFDLTPSDILMKEGLFWDILGKGVSKNNWTKGHLDYVPDTTRRLREEKEALQRQRRALIESCQRALEQSIQR